MLLEELVVHNFGVYRGRHQIPLANGTPDKPIILFGALNGGGKTTLLDALKLSLYGKFAPCSNRGSLSYPDYLRQTINHQVDPSDGAGVELQFSFRHDGTEERIRVIRTWKATGKGLKETAEVLRDGASDPVLADRWYEYIAEFVPADVCNFFFFDGEKIETLVSEDESAKLIRTGLHALLGLDLVDRLTYDLKAIERKRRANHLTVDDDQGLKNLSAQVKELEYDLSQETEVLAEARTNLQQCVNRIARLRVDYQAQGGDLLEQRDVIEAQLSAAETRLDEVECQLRELAAGAAPLLLVRDLLHDALQQAELESQASADAHMVDMLSHRDSQLLALIEKHNAGRALQAAVSSFLSDDLDQRRGRAAIPCYLHALPSDLGSVSSPELSTLTNQLQGVLDQHRRAEEDVASAQRLRSAIPNPESLAQVSHDLEEAQGTRSELATSIKAREHHIEGLSSRLAAKRKQYEAEFERATEAAFKDELNSRILRQGENLRSALSTFRVAVAKKHIRQLEGLIADSFRQISRKPDLIKRVSICPDTYRLSVFTEKGGALPSERLSAGERQLLSTAILWALAKASDRPLPTVIDTPLGRLDGHHRALMLNNYFPSASHQVLLLSTDEEIDQKAHKALRPFVGAEYTIRYIPEQTSSVVIPGYFAEA